MTTTPQTQPNSPFKIAFIGAGSVGFTRKLLQDLLSVPEFQAPGMVKIAFHDIAEGNLEKVTQLCQQDIDANGLDIRIEASLDRRQALSGARYIICCVRVGGLEAFETDIDIPLKYGLDQCVGDTLCAGGLMYAQRGIPAILDFCRDIREVAEPNALLLNYANPMAMMTWAATKYGDDVRTVGLCHGVQGGHGLIASVFGLKKEEVDIICAGINHQTWYISVKHLGEDITDRVLEAFEKPKHAAVHEREKVRIDMLRRFGYFSTESNGHLSEYVPWYRKREDEIPAWISLNNWINGETGGYLRHCRSNHDWEKDFEKWLSEPAKKFVPEERSEEHGSYIIESLETGRIYRGHFNVQNNGVISNLPADCIVEAPGYVDRNGISMPVVGDLPLGCAAVCQSSVQVQRLGVEAAVHGDDTLLRQAMMLDPLTGAVLNPPEIWQMTDELLVAGEPWLPQYKEAIAAAKERLAQDPEHLIPTREGYRGAARRELVEAGS